MQEQTKGFDLNSRDAADFLGCCLTSLRKYRKLGLVPSYKLGSKYKYRSSELVTFLKLIDNGRI